MRQPDYVPRKPLPLYAQAWNANQTRQLPNSEVARTIISIAIARTTAITLIQGANTLTVTGHTGF